MEAQGQFPVEEVINQGANSAHQEQKQPKGAQHASLAHQGTAHKQGKQQQAASGLPGLKTTVKGRTHVGEGGNAADETG